MFEWLRKDKWTESKENELSQLRKDIEFLEEELIYEERRRLLAELLLELASEYQDYFKGAKKNV